MDDVYGLRDKKVLVVGAQDRDSESQGHDCTVRVSLALRLRVTDATFVVSMPQMQSPRSRMID